MVQLFVRGEQKPTRCADQGFSRTTTNDPTIAEGPERTFSELCPEGLCRIIHQFDTCPLHHLLDFRDMSRNAEQVRHYQTLGFRRDSRLYCRYGHVEVGTHVGKYRGRSSAKHALKYGFADVCRNDYIIACGDAHCAKPHFDGSTAAIERNDIRHSAVFADRVNRSVDSFATNYLSGGYGSACRS